MTIRRNTTKTWQGYRTHAPKDSASYATAPALTRKGAHTIANTPVTTLSEHRPPCSQCLNIAHRGMLQALRYPDGHYRQRWEAWAAETFLYAYTHPVARCNNTIRIG